MLRAALAMIVILMPLPSHARPGPEGGERSATTEEREPAPPACAPGASPDRRCWQQLDPRFLAAVRRRNAGIGITATFGGIGGGMLVVSGFWSFFAWLGDLSREGEHVDYRVQRSLAIAGACSVAAGLAIRLPLLISGTSELRSIRRLRLPVPTVA